MAFFRDYIWFSLSIGSVDLSEHKYKMIELENIRKWK